jgi:hypothetical protein
MLHCISPDHIEMAVQDYRSGTIVRAAGTGDYVAPAVYDVLQLD